MLTCGTYGNVLRFLPPLVMPDHLLDEGLDILETAFADAGHEEAPSTVIETPAREGDGDVPQRHGSENGSLVRCEPPLTLRGGWSFPRCFVSDWASAPVRSWSSTPWTGACAGGRRTLARAVEEGPHGVRFAADETDPLTAEQVREIMKRSRR